MVWWVLEPLSGFLSSAVTDLVRDLLLQPMAFRFCLLQQNLPAFLSPA
jgi:hypothetical protein